VTDRFIPSRKLLKRDSLMHGSEINPEQENEISKSEGNNANVSDLYRRLIMAESGRQNK